MLNQNDIRARATAQTFARGQKYFRDGLVSSLARRGDELHGQVEGSDIEPYRIAVSLRDDLVEEAECTCPYDYDGWCKHIVAVLLAWLERGEAIVTLPPLEEILADLSREQLRALILQLARQDGDLYDAIAAQVANLKQPAHSNQSTLAPVETLAYRQQVRAAVRQLNRLSSSEAYWQASGATEKIVELAYEAEPFLERGDGQGALLILEAVTDEWAKNCAALDDSEGEVWSVFEALEPLWCEALLSVELPRDERDEWVRKLERWRKAVTPYGYEDAFQRAQEAAREGWDDDLLQRRLKGENSGFEPRPQWRDDDLLAARLKILERQQRFDEALNLAYGAGLSGDYVRLLLLQNRVAEAVTHALKYFGAAEEARAFASTLHERSEIASALQVARHGLNLHGFVAPLALWLREAAAAAGDRELALQAARVVLREQPQLPDYQRARELAGDGWPQMREEVLEKLRAFKGDQSGAVEIFLHEECPDDALRLVRHNWDDRLVARVAEALAEVRPDEVLPICLKHAESIMNEGRSDRYENAVDWLRHARRAQRAASREAAWQKYLEALLDKHQKKRKLVPMLQTLRK